MHGYGETRGLKTPSRNLEDFTEAMSNLKAYSNIASLIFRVFGDNQMARKATDFGKVCSRLEEISRSLI